MEGPSRRKGPDPASWTRGAARRKAGSSRAAFVTPCPLC